MMKKIRQKICLFQKDETGQTLAETAVTILVFLMLILGIMQLALIFNAKMMVKYAAFCAARSAIVYSGDINRARDAARIACAPLEGLTLGSVVALGFINVNINSSISSQPLLFDNISRREENLITVTVTYYYELIIPYVNRIFCQLSSNAIAGRIPISASYTMRMQSDR